MSGLDEVALTVAVLGIAWLMWTSALGFLERAVDPLAATVGRHRAAVRDLLRGLAGDLSVPSGTRTVLRLAVGYLWVPFPLTPAGLVGSPAHDVVAALGVRRAVRTATRETLAAHWPGPEATLETLLRAADRA